MDQQETRAIVANPFPGPEERMAYCTHCLNPINTGEPEMDDMGIMYPMTSSESRGMLLQRVLKCTVRDATDMLEKEPHTCTKGCQTNRGKHVAGNPILEHEDAVCREAFREVHPDTTMFCPTCHLPIHDGEGPLNARGYRAELLRRLCPQEFQATREMFRALDRAA